MKRIAFLSVMITLLVMGGSCDTKAQQTGKNAGVTAAETVEIIYFHMTRRCLTCNAVESEAIKHIEALYPRQVKAGTVKFISVNLEEESSKPIMERARTTGQSLLVISGDKRTDLTNVGFMYARSQPQRFRQAIKNAIDPLLKK